MNTKERILANTVGLLAKEGYNGSSIRRVAELAGIQASVIYNYFPDKQSLMREARTYVADRLDEVRPQWHEGMTAKEYLRNVITYQFEQQEYIVAMTQYFIAVKQEFSKTTDDGYVPTAAYRHMKRLIEVGMTEDVYFSKDPAFDAKILLHLVNGFLLEYYSHEITPAERQRTINRIIAFIDASLRAEAAGNNA